ncbi:DUF190 domain-containing protein [Aquifex aeolicus]|uniref:UPF0166 protein aq_448 n=1 Tax=Aquifex aeolicus (strain VF5) TaxID=224324 RepID=Y448_AQUAE|nr:DUF190 domain-containing protein [Aquifex aeolicus]O66756.1 RecName: Full=UPF0166 protein aq_448 [Aquifex aeolicus VF5]AAC06717.1 putative protein [Aquifex aeolicus VF5]
MKEVLMRIYSSKEENLEDYINKLFEGGIRGAVVLQGIAGFGKGREFHSEEIEVLSYELPVVIEVVEDREKLLNFLKENRETFKNCYITFERVKVWE